MNVFSAVKVYNGKWEEKEERAFSPEELDEIKSARVVDSEYGSSVCFMMKAGGTSYIPLSRDSSKAVGDEIDVKSARLVVLGRSGSEDIYRVKA